LLLNEFRLIYEVKVKSLVLTKYHATKTYPVLD